MSRVEQITLDVAAYAKSTDLADQRFYARQVMIGCHVTGESMHRFLVPASTNAANGVQCPVCKEQYKNEHALRAHVGRKHKS